MGRKDIYARARQRMVETQIIARGIQDKRVIDAMLKIPRHLFIEEALWGQAYNDYPLPIGEGQTISQPFIVALMIEKLELKGKERVLEIGTGSGYQTALLSLLVEKVYSIERVASLAVKARKVLDRIGSANVLIRIGDGTQGWTEEAPFDNIIVSAASPKLPAPYIEQLINGGSIVIPIGSEYEQLLVKFTKIDGGLKEESVGGCRFVKLIGRYGWSAKRAEGMY